MSVRQIFAAVGTVVGAYFGAPQLGYMIGSAIGGWVDPEIIKGPEIGDLAQQTSQEGVPRPIVFGMSPPMAGNIIATGPPRKKKKRTSQGKGGPKVETEYVLRTYAVGICEGPITRVLRVWRNGELVWDDRENDELNYHDFNDAELIEYVFRRLTNNTVWEQKVQFFEGTYDQEAPAALEEIFGVGTTPAHRGTAYMLVVDDDVTDQRGAIPQYMFQVERCEGYYLTSRPYAVEVIEPLQVSADARDTDHPLYVEALDVGADFISASFGEVLHTYTGLPEALDMSADFIGGEFKDVLLEYEDGAPEALDMSADLLAGELAEVLVEYENGAPEALDMSAALISGSLT